MAINAREVNVGGGIDGGERPGIHIWIVVNRLGIFTMTVVLLVDSTINWSLTIE
jgi:hypothetical protein